MGVKLKERNLAQVSMNLTDFEQTPMHLAFEVVKREATRYGVGIAGSEIVGLVPKRAIEMCADYFLQLENFHPRQILENRLAEVLAGRAAEPGPGQFAAACRPFLEAVSGARATPGGGSVSALAGALAAALGQMVAGLSRAKKAFAGKAPELSERLMRLQDLGDKLAEAIDRDAQSYERVMLANRMPKDAPAEQSAREEKMQEALKAAIAVPLDVAETSSEVAKILGELPEMTSPAMASDLSVASLMAAAAIRGAIVNVRINTPGLKDEAFLAEVQSRVDRLEAGLTGVGKS
jgi:formiminotetrahydrofolate cyclodeaminase